MYCVGHTVRIYNSRTILRYSWQNAILNSRLSLRYNNNNNNNNNKECKNKGDTSNNKSDWNHFQIIQKIRE